MFQKLIDIFITYFHWLLFISGIIIVFAFFPLLYVLSLLAKDQKFFFQAFLYYSFRTFFWVMERLIPRLTFKIDQRHSISKIRSSLIISNHLSYLDGIYLLSVIKNIIPIIKPVYFKVPVLGWIIRLAGFIPARSENKLNMESFYMLDRLEDHFQQGGNLLIFPEGKRSHTGELNKFKKGPFTLAKKLNVPIEVLQLQNTDLLFGRDKSLLFNTKDKNVITLKRIGHIPSNGHVETCQERRPKKLKEDVYNIYINEMKKG